MNLITVWLPQDEKREVFTAKTDSGYVGCVITDKCMIMTKEHYAKPLVAANAARKLNKVLKEVVRKKVSALCTVSMWLPFHTTTEFDRSTTAQWKWIRARMR